jgi:hypothetical protein
MVDEEYELIESVGGVDEMYQLPPFKYDFHQFHMSKNMHLKFGKMSNVDVLQFATRNTQVVT